MKCCLLLHKQSSGPRNETEYSLLFICICLAVWLCLKMGSENMMLVRLLQTWANNLTVDGMKKSIKVHFWAHFLKLWFTKLYQIAPLVADPQQWNFTTRKNQQNLNPPLYATVTLNQTWDVQIVWDSRRYFIPQHAVQKSHLYQQQFRLEGTYFCIK